MSDAFDLDRVGGARALRELVSEVLAAGEDALALFRMGAAKRVRTKPDRSPVTEADHAVEQRLRAFCARRFPDVGFLGEETGAGPATDAPMRFVVDPIDGTRAFLRGIPTWSILVGLEAESVPVVGVALIPSTGDLFVGVRGDGADGNGRPCVISEVSKLEDAVISHGGLEQFTSSGRCHLLERIGEATYSQRGFGDFEGYKHLLLGRVDGVIDPGVQPWDLCAPAVLVREAGGRLTAFDGTETIHGGSGVASNGRIHEALVALIAD